MTGPPRTAPASMAAYGVSTLLAAVALAGWNPAPGLFHARAHQPHHPRRPSACTHLRTQRHGGEAATNKRHGAPKRCTKLRRHAAAPPRTPHPEGSTAPVGSTGAPGSAGAPSGQTAPPVSTPGSGEGPTPPPSLPEVQVSAVEYHFTLSRTTVPAGKVIIEFVDKGQDEHNLNAEGAGGPPAVTFATELPKAVSRQTVELRPGSYTLFCSLGDHEAKGMKATLTVE